MFSFPRSAARRLRLLARKSLAGRPRGPAPPVWVYPDRRGITIAVTEKHVVVVADDVTAFLMIDAPGRYLDVASVFPKLRRQQRSHSIPGCPVSARCVADTPGE